MKQRLILCALVLIYVQINTIQSACPQKPEESPCNFYKDKDTSVNMEHAKLYSSNVYFLQYLEEKPDLNYGGPFDIATPESCCQICFNDPICITFGVFNGADDLPILCATSSGYYPADVNSPGTVFGYVRSRLTPKKQ
jgi:hypothetical protein